MKTVSHNCFEFAELPENIQNRIISDIKYSRFWTVQKETDEETRSLGWWAGLRAKASVGSDFTHLYIHSDKGNYHPIDVGAFLERQKLQDKYPRIYRVRNRNHGIWLNASAIDHGDYGFLSSGVHKKRPWAAEFKKFQKDLERIVREFIPTWQKSAAKIREKYYDKQQIRESLLACTALLFNEQGLFVPDPYRINSAPMIEYTLKTCRK